MKNISDDFPLKGIIRFSVLSIFFSLSIGGKNWYFKSDAKSLINTQIKANESFKLKWVKKKTKTVKKLIH